MSCPPYYTGDVRVIVDSGSGSGSGVSIDDSTPSTTTTYSGSKIDALVSAVDAAHLEINDATPSATTTYSGSKIDALVSAVDAAHLQINDATPSATTTYSGSKIDALVSAVDAAHLQINDNGVSPNFVYSSNKTQGMFNEHTVRITALETTASSAPQFYSYTRNGAFTADELAADTPVLLYDDDNIRLDWYKKDDGVNDRGVLLVTCHLINIVYKILPLSHREVTFPNSSNFRPQTSPTEYAVFSKTVPDGHVEFAIHHWGTLSANPVYRVLVTLKQVNLGHPNDILCIQVEKQQPGLQPIDLTTRTQRSLATPSTTTTSSRKKQKIDGSI